MMRRVVFLDRDGTVNVDEGYLHDPDRLELVEGVVEALQTLQSLGFELVIVTNQSGIGRGYYDEDDYHAVTNALIKELEKEGVEIKESFYCPHAPEEGCECRKPGTGMVDAYLADVELDRENSFMVGDKTSDLKFAENLGVNPVLVRTGKGGGDGRFEVEPVYVADDLLDAAGFISERV